MKFENLNLHDAVLVALEYTWHSKVLLLKGVLCRSGSDAVILRFNGVDNFRVPHAEDWGPSSSVNRFWQEGSTYMLEMQSGDVISINAGNFEYECENT